MKTIDPEKLLWRLPSEGKGEEQAAPPEQLLADYRAGRLSEEQMRRLEARIAHHPTAWTRLAKLAGIEFAEPSPGLRDRVLHGFTRAQPGPRRAWLALAASLIGVLGLLGLYGLSRWDREAAAPPGQHEVQIAALQAVRSAGESGQSADAFAHTRVTILARAHVAESGLEYGLYRHSEASGLVRLRAGLSPDSPVTLETFRGAAEFKARARDLIGTEPGDYDLYAVVAREGDLPDAVALQDGQDPVLTLASGDRRRVYHLRLRLLPQEARIEWARDGSELIHQRLSGP